MLDTLIIHVPMSSEFVVQTGNLYSVKGDVADYQIKAVPSYLKRDLLTGEVTYGDLRHPFESLPTSYSGMAIKFNAVNVANTYPYISLNASPKILQGHNVFGGESVKNLASEMLNLLKQNYPAFFACLDVRNASISRIDSTYSVRVEHERLIQPCLRFLSNIKNGQRKSDKDKRDFYNTIYFGGQTSRFGNAVIYGKGYDVDREVKDLQKRSKNGCLNSTNKLKIFTPELIEFAKNLLRFESRTKKRKLEQIGLPTNLWDFIKHQEKNRDVLAVLWRLWFDPIFNSLEGDVMADKYDDDHIFDMCMNKAWVQNYKKEISALYRPHFLNYLTSGLPMHSSFILADRHADYFYKDYHFNLIGKISYTKAKNAFNFYQLLKSNGWDDMKKRYSNNAFHTAVRSLVKSGIPRSFLQNLHEEKDITIPLVTLLNFDTTNQHPDGYEPPVSAHINDFNMYLKPKLKLVS